MKKTRGLTMAFVAASLLFVFVACDDGRTESDETAVNQEDEIDAEETPTEEPEDKGKKGKGGGPPGREAGCKRPSRAAPTRSLARVMKGTVVPLDRMHCDIEGTINMVRLPSQEKRTVMSLDIQGLDRKATYEVFVHTKPCKDGGGPPYLLDAKAPAGPDNLVGGKFSSEGRSVAELEKSTRGSVGKEGVSIVIYEDGHPVACADLLPLD
jgi:hypothetical protein